MKNASPTQAALVNKLLNAILWELSLLGHKSIDLLRALLEPGSWFRSLPHVRILIVLSMLILIFDEDVSFSLQFGETNSALAATTKQPKAIKAGPSSSTAGFFSSLASSSTFVKTDLTITNSETGNAIISRFESTARAEQEKLGVDAGVLLATAIASGVVDSPEQVSDKNFVTNYFGEALNGSYPTAWSSWRAMSLTLAASVNTDRPTRDEFVRAAAAQYPNKTLTQKRIYEALRFYQL